MLIDILLYVTGALLCLWLLLNLFVYLWMRWWISSSLRNLKQVLEAKDEE